MVNIQDNEHLLFLFKIFFDFKIIPDSLVASDFWISWHASGKKKVVFSLRDN